MTDDLGVVVGDLRRYFASGKTRPISWRDAQLHALSSLMREGSPALEDALTEDLGKARLESFVSETSVVEREVRTLRRGLREWMRDEKVSVPAVLLPARARVSREPLGVILVIAPWNYPVNLTLVPLAAAIAAGNCVVVKPSEMAPATSAVLARLIGQYLDPEAVQVVEGGAEATIGLVNQRPDHILFTGGARVGHLVMAEAAKSGTPVTLELGGKNPAIVTSSANSYGAARRIVWGRFLNAGQTCIGVDYVLVERAAKDAFVSDLIRSVNHFYGAQPHENADYGRIVNEARLDRLASFLVDHGGQVVLGGEVDRKSRYVAPTIVLDPSSDALMMNEEIFGPILPGITVDDLSSAITYVQGQPTPLAAYVFSSKQNEIQRVTNEVRSGGLCVNTTLEHFIIPDLPFGGLGASGFGSYHGRSGFETFTHQRAVLSRPARGLGSIAFPPYSRVKSKVLRKVLRATALQRR